MRADQRALVGGREANEHRGDVAGRERLFELRARTPPDPRPAG